MRDVFGADDIKSDGATASPPPAAGGAMTATAPAPVPAAAGPAPTLQQAVAKATAKATADAKVATDPHAVHNVKLAPLAPTVVSSTGAGAALGFLLGGPPGALLGAAVGWTTERYGIAGAPVGRAIAKAKAMLAKAQGK